jgi:hypothetical protein
MMAPLSDPLLRLLGADPGTFRPLYRVQKLLLKRTVRSMRARKGAFSFSPFTLLCIFAGVYGSMGALTLATAKSHLLGALFSLILGCAFLLLVVVADNFDVLINPRETLLLGACPQDGRSFLLAKLAALGRHLSILAFLLFGPPGIATALVFNSAWAGAAFWAGAAAASVSTLTFGILFAAAVLRLRGRNALDRLLPWIQGAFQIGYLVVLGGQRMSVLLTAASPSAVGVLAWALPPFWFLSPLELTTAGPSAPALGRLVLAVATPALLLGDATRWLGSGLREQLLEPQRQTTAGRRPVRRRPAIRSRGGERARLFALLRVQLRADWRVRSEFLLVPVMGIFLMIFYLRNFGIVRSIPLMVVYFYCWMLMTGSHALIRSSRPDSLWWILVSPIDRARFSLGTVALVRLFHLAPLSAAMAVALIRAGGTWPLRLAVLAELLALGDLLVVTGKGMFPDFPFSQSRTDEGGAGARTALALMSSVFGGLTTAGVFLFGLYGIPGALAGAAFFALLHIPAWMWASRRATGAAESLEMTTSVA